MSLDLLISQVQDPVARENFRKIMDFVSAQGFAGQAFQACELYVTGNQAGLKIKHKQSSVPKDVLVARLIAPSAARLVIDYANFTDTSASFDVTGLASGEVLHARLLLGTFQDVVTVGDSQAIEDPTQQIRSKF